MGSSFKTRKSEFHPVFARLSKKACNKELRGFTPIGILEYWSIGRMGLKEFKIDFFPAYTPNIPLFHYSIIPCVLHKSIILKKLYDLNVL